MIFKAFYLLVLILPMTEVATRNERKIVMPSAE